MKKVSDILWSYRWTLLAGFLFLGIPYIVSTLPMHWFFADRGITQMSTTMEFYERLSNALVARVQHDAQAHSFMYWTADEVFCVKDRFVPESLVDTGVYLSQVYYVEGITVASYLAAIYLFYVAGFSSKLKTKTAHSFKQINQNVVPQQNNGKQAQPVGTKMQQKPQAKTAIKTISFDDVAGYKETKQSLQFLVSCLRNPEQLQSIGSKMPNGVLLYGPPGTGKTMIAKAIACTAGVPFLYASGSQFMEVFVGTGAKSVRELYENARKMAPCVVFIDEIDAIGSSRSGSTTDSERKHTLDALLVELDGILGNEGILTIAATNLVSELDAALLRSGRFDRKIAVPLPNKEDRLEILKVHARGKRMQADVRLEDLAGITAGMSGADLAGLMNEAGIIALQRGETAISKAHIDDAIIQIATGGEIKESTDKAVKKLVAYHEAGHAVAFKLIARQSVPRVTIIGSTSGVGGITFSEDENKFPTKEHMENHICCCYAGRAAEELVFGKQNITVGASNDIKQATSMIRQYLVDFGMNDEYGLLNMDVLNHSPFSDADDETVRAAKSLSETLYQKTLNCLRENRKQLDTVASELMRVKTLTDKDLDRLLN